MTTRQPYENLKWRIHNIPKSTDLLEEFPDLRKHVENGALKSDTQQNEIIRYLIYLYDKGSDLIKEEPDLQKRKQKARELSGLSENHSLDKLMSMAFYFTTKMLYDRKLREWHTLHLELEENHKARWTPIDIDDEVDVELEDGETKTKTRSSQSQKNSMDVLQKKGPLRQQAFEIQKFIDIVEEELWGDSDDIRAKANEWLMTTPERVAAAYSGVLVE